MYRIVGSVVILGVLIAISAPRASNQKDKIQTARGVVYHDRNGNQTFDEGDEPLAGIRVSNGHQIVRTNDQGVYELTVDDDNILFVIKPRNWRTPLSEDMLPRFYYIHKPNGSPDLRYGGVEPTGPLRSRSTSPCTRRRNRTTSRRSCLATRSPATRGKSTGSPTMSSRSWSVPMRRSA